MSWKYPFAVLLIILSASPSISQDNTNTSAKYTTWAILQAVPSPVLMQDANDIDSRVQFGLRWQIIPINISFRANKYISPVQFFMINPVRKFTGSIEVFVQPEWATASFEYANLNRFGISAGTRLTLPVLGDGENMSASIGGKYNYRKDYDGGDDGTFGIEAGIYGFYSILGLQFNYNFNSNSNYNIGLYFKYF